MGGGTPERGIRELVDALALLPASCELELRFAGTITPEYFAELQTRPGWKRVRYLGWQSRAQVAELLGSARMGVVVFLPIANHMNSEPTKLFEYMSAKLPVVASNIPHWIEMVEGHNYAAFADPTRPAAIAAALCRLYEDPSDSEQMGLRGYEAVMSQFNWKVASDNGVPTEGSWPDHVRDSRNGKPGPRHGERRAGARRLGDRASRTGWRRFLHRAMGTVEHAVAGHRRLSIIDLSPAGKQPMTHDGHVVAYNGELFNYKEIRAEIGARAGPFRSESDTEVLLKALSLWAKTRSGNSMACGALPGSIGRGGGWCSPATGWV